MKYGSTNDVSIEIANESKFDAETRNIPFVLLLNLDFTMSMYNDDSWIKTKVSKTQISGQMLEKLDY